MGRKSFLGMAACGLAASALIPTVANAAQDRVSATEKGSLLIYSKVEVRWNSSGNLIQDTFLTMSNDSPNDVQVQMYFINGDAPAYAGELDGCAHYGWNFSDVLFELTGNQPTYWSVNDPGSFTPFRVLDPDQGCGVGRPAGDDSGDRLIRGMVYGWAVVKDDGGAGMAEITHNHLSGGGTLINYDQKTAWEYNAWAFQRNGDDGQVNQLSLNGTEYATCFSHLLLNFQAVGSEAFSADGYSVVTDTDVTLHPVSIDFLVDDPDTAPITTKAHYDVWNENEIKLSGAYRCITCWDQTLLSDYGTPNHFRIDTLQTDHGKARIDGLASTLCDEFPVVVSEATAILGLASRDYMINSPNVKARSGSNLIGMGEEDAVIRYPQMDAPPEAPQQKEMREVKRALRQGIGR